jgi:Protein of unknown function (DUF3574)
MKRELVLRILAMSVILLFVGAFFRVIVNSVDSDVTDCAPGFEALRETRLFMGRDIKGTREVSDADWRAFVKAEVIPRFPDGFTVFDGAGYWRGCEGMATPNPSQNGVCEKSKLLLIQYAPSEKASSAVSAIAQAYITAFSQQAVMRSDTQVCTQFISGK